jgi:Flp pilus assembly protein TadG
MRALLRERGSATLEIAILGPALLLTVFVVVQVSMWAYARSLALAAAQEGASAAAAYGATPGDGAARARAVLRDSAGDSIGEVGVASGRDAATARVEVTGRSLSVLPGVPGIRVVQSAEAPRERFVPDLEP